MKVDRHSKIVELIGKYQIETQEELAEYLKQAGNAAPASWSQQARTWAEKAGIIAGGEGKGERYGSFATREEIVQMLWRLSQQK